jgi:hypothetical protein
MTKERSDMAAMDYECVIRSTEGAEIGRVSVVLAADAPLHEVRSEALETAERHRASIGMPLDIERVGSVDVRGGRFVEQR